MLGREKSGFSSTRGSNSHPESKFQHSKDANESWFSYSTRCVFSFISLSLYFWCTIWVFGLSYLLSMTMAVAQKCPIIFTTLKQPSLLLADLLSRAFFTSLKYGHLGFLYTCDLMCKLNEWIDRLAQIGWSLLISGRFPIGDMTASFDFDPLKSSK